MAEKNSSTKAAPKAAPTAATKPASKAATPAKRTAVDGSSAKFTAEEQAAMKERAQELKAQKGKADGESDLLAKIAEMPPTDRAMATRLHGLIKAAAPTLTSKTWYGMPAYARDGKVICFFQSAAKFKARYATFGFSEDAHLDDGEMWPTSFALKKLTPTQEARIVALVKKAVG